MTTARARMGDERRLPATVGLGLNDAGHEQARRVGPLGERGPAAHAPRLEGGAKGRSEQRAGLGCGMGLGAGGEVAGDWGRPNRHMEREG